MRFAKGLVAVGATIAAYWAALAMPGALPAVAATACSAPHGAHVLARRGRVLAWSDAPRQGHESRTTVVACFRPNGRRHTLYESSPHLWPPSFSQVKTAGAMFAVVVIDGGGFGSTGDLLVSNVRTGQRQFLQQVQFSTDYMPSPYADLVDYALDSAGDVGWIESVGERRIPPAESTGSDYVRLHTVTGTRTLDAASSISDVAIANGAVQWVADGVTRSAPLVLAGSRAPAGPARRSVKPVGPRYRFYRYSRPKPPPPEAVPPTTASSGEGPTAELGPPVSEHGAPERPSDEARCYGYARLPQAPLLLGIVEWTIEPVAKSLYPARFRRSACQRGVALSSYLSQSKLRPTSSLTTHEWRCRTYETSGYHGVVEIKLSCRTRQYAFSAYQTNVITLDVEEASNYPPPGAMNLEGDAVPVRAQRGPGWAVQPGLDRWLDQLKVSYVVGRHRCVVSAAITEGAMASAGALVEAGQGIYPPNLDYPVAELPPGSYWACMYLQQGPDDPRAATLMESSADVVVLPVVP